eukprot:5704116-Karenia_brevis.AAC.1
MAGSHEQVGFASEEEAKMLDEFEDASQLFQQVGKVMHGKIQLRRYLCELGELLPSAMRSKRGNMAGLLKAYAKSFESFKELRTA